MVDRHGVFTALEEDVYELGVMSTFFTGMKMIFVSVLGCAIYIKSFTEFINHLERLSGRLVTNVQHCYAESNISEKNQNVYEIKFLAIILL